jgi:hypothetical protein
VTSFEVVKAIRKNVLTEIDRIVDEAIGELERHEAWRLAIPGKYAGGEWDWFRHLERKEQRRIESRWMSEFGQGPDLIAHSWHLDVDEAMAEWLRYTRIIHLGLSMKIRKSGRGYVPKSTTVGGFRLDDLYPDSGYALESLFAPSPTCCEYLDELDRDMREDAEYREVTQWIDSSTLELATF